MLDIRGLDILVSKGDTEDFVITFEDDVPPDNTNVIVSLKKFPNNNKPLWEKSAVVKDGEFKIRLNSSDTNISSGIYSWDMALIYADNTVYHPMNPAKFQVVEVVSYAGEQGGIQYPSPQIDVEPTEDIGCVKHMKVRINHAHTVYEIYDAGGDDPEFYNVISDPYNDQVLETKWKVMADDITIKKIPYSDATNPEGGRTVYIG